MRSFASLFLVFSLFSIQLSQAQECREGAVEIGNVIDERNGRSLFLMECRSGTFDLLSSQQAERFLEAHRNDSTFISRMAILSGCEFEECLRVAQSHSRVTLYANPNNATEVRYLNYFADKYRTWLTNNRTESSSRLKRCNAIRWSSSRGQVSCWLWECEGIRGAIALQPSNQRVRGLFEHCGITGCNNVERTESLSDMIHYGRPAFQRFDGNLKWISVPTGVAYNRNGHCDGPFDQIIRSQKPNSRGRPRGSGHNR